MEVNISKIISSYEVHFTNCLPKRFDVKEGENINQLIQDHIRKQNKGVTKSERIKLEKINRLFKLK